jgi:glycosyltransferase involved in cell wall biosynthesis
MKILQVTPVYYPSIGGVEEHVRSISERMAWRHEVTVYTTNHSGKLPEEETLNNVRIKRFGCWSPHGTYHISRDLKKQLDETLDEFDLVHAHSYHAFPALYVAQAESRTPFVFTPHYNGGGGTRFRDLLHIFYKFWGSRIFREADKVVCVSRYEKELIIKDFDVDDDKVLFIPNGVNSADFDALKKRKKEYRTVLTVARLEKYKGVQYLIQCLPRLDNDIILEIVGTGGYKGTLVSLAKRLGVSERVRFYDGFDPITERTQLLQRYVNADVFALLSKREAMPITLIEALAAHTPCIVTGIPFLTEWVDNMSCFRVSYPVNIEELALLIKQVIGRRIETSRVFDWKEVVNRLEEIYNSLNKN